jgi:hypothetical protein
MWLMIVQSQKWLSVGWTAGVQNLSRNIGYFSPTSGTVMGPTHQTHKWGWLSLTNSDWALGWANRARLQAGQRFLSLPQIRTGLTECFELLFMNNVKETPTAHCKTLFQNLWKPSQSLQTFSGPLFEPRSSRILGESDITTYRLSI